MVLNSGALPVANPGDVARGDFNDGMTQLDAAFPLAAVNLGTNAVETVKIKDKNITVPKLADDILVEGLAVRPFFYEEFIGAVLDNRWAATGDAGGSVTILDKALCQIKTGGVVNDDYRIDWNGKKAYTIDTMKPIMVVLVQGHEDTDVDIFIGFYRDANNFYGFRYRDAVSRTWYAVCKAVGAETAVDTGIDLAGGGFAGKIEYISGTEVKFYINGVLKNTIATNVPTGDMEFRTYLETTAALLKVLRLKYIGISATRV